MQLTASAAEKPGPPSSKVSPTPEGSFIGRSGVALPRGTNQFPFYGCRIGRDGSMVVRLHEDMVKQTGKVRDASGKGFDTEAEANEWVDSFILAEYPAALEEFKRKMVLCEGQLQGALNRSRSA